MKEIALVVSLIVVIVVAIAIGETYQPPEENLYSSKSKDLQGSLAFYLLLEKYTAVERLYTFGTLEPGSLIMINPVRLPSSEEIEYLYKWVEKGNRLVVFSDDPGIMQIFGITLAKHEMKRAVISPSREHWSTTDVKSIEMVYDRSFQAHSGDVLFADGDNPVVIDIKKGEGEIILVATPSLTSNIEIDSMDNEIFLVRVSLSDKVYFDEYHGQLVREKKGLGTGLKTMFSSEYTSFFVQLTVALALFLVAHGKRFGGSRPEIPREVQSSELVLSAADLYYKAGKKEILEMLEEGDLNQKEKSKKERGVLHV